MADEVKVTDHPVTPGEELRVAREERGISLGEAARQTCIGISYLEALEADRYEQLPNPAYVKGMIRSYARILGVPPEPLIHRYTQEAEPEEPPDEQQGEEFVPTGRKPWLLLIIGVVICAVYMLAQHDTGHDLHQYHAGQIMPMPLPLEGIMPPRTSSHAHPLPSPKAPTEVLPGEELPVESAPALIPGKSVLKAKILTECRLTMTIDDMPSQQYDLKTGDQVEWIGVRYFALEMDNAGAIEVILNDKPLPSLGKSGDTATVVITADGQIQ